MTEWEMDRLIRRVAAGDARAIAELRRSLEKRGLLFCVAYFAAFEAIADRPDIVKDAMQRAFLGMVAAIQSGKYRHESEKGLFNFYFLVLRRRCVEELRKIGSSGTEYVTEEQNGVIVEAKRTSRRFHARFTATRSEDHDAAIMVAEDETPGPGKSPEAIVLEAHGVLALVQALAVTAQLLHDVADNRSRVRALGIVGARSAAEALEALIGYIKLKAGAVPGSRLQALGSLLTERIIGSSAPIVFDEIEAWFCVACLLGISANAAQQRKRRLIDALPKLPGIPEPLRYVVGLIWHDDMHDWVMAAETAANNAYSSDKFLSATMEVVANYLRWIWVSGHPVYKTWSHDRIAAVGVEELLETNNPALLQPLYPSYGGFQDYVARFCPQSRAIRNLPTVRRSLMESKPRSEKLLSLIKLLALPTRTRSGRKSK